MYVHVDVGQSLVFVSILSYNISIHVHVHVYSYLFIICFVKQVKEVKKLLRRVKMIRSYQYQRRERSLTRRRKMVKL